MSMCQMAHVPAAGSSVALLACGSFNPPTYMHLRMFEVARDYVQRVLGCQVTEGIISPVGDNYPKPGLVAARHRIRMLELALHSSNWIRTDSWEACQPKWLPTVHALRHYRDSLLKHKAGTSNAADESSRLDEASPTKITRVSTSSPPASVVSYSTDASQNGSSSGGGGSGDGSTTPRLMLLCGGDLLNSFFTPNLWTDDDIAEILRDFGLIVLNRAGVDIISRISESGVLTKYAANIHLIDDRANPNECSSTRIRAAIRHGQSIKYLVDDGVEAYIREHGLYGVSQDPASPAPHHSAPAFGALARHYGVNKHGAAGSSFDSAVTSLSQTDRNSSLPDTDELRQYDLLNGGGRSFAPDAAPLNWAPACLLLPPAAAQSPLHLNSYADARPLYPLSIKNVHAASERSRAKARALSQRIRRSRTEHSALADRQPLITSPSRTAAVTRRQNAIVIETDDEKPSDQQPQSWSGGGGGGLAVPGGGAAAVEVDHVNLSWSYTNQLQTGDDAGHTIRKLSVLPRAMRQAAEAASLVAQPAAAPATPTRTTSPPQPPPKPQQPPPNERLNQPFPVCPADELSALISGCERVHDDNSVYDLRKLSSTSSPNLCLLPPPPGSPQPAIKPAGSGKQRSKSPRFTVADAVANNAGPPETTV